MVKLSHSSRKALHACPRKFMLHSRFKRPYTPRMALQLGVAFHKLMELSLTTKPEDILEAYGKWSHAVILDHRTQPEETLSDLRDTHDKAVALWRGYLTHTARLKPRVIQVLAAEFRFVQEISDVQVPGVIDTIALIENPWFNVDSPRAVNPEKKEIVAIGDYKTTGIDLDHYLQSLLRSEQLQTYAIWCKSNDFAREFPEIVGQYGAPAAVYFDVIQTLKIRQKKTETRQQFLGRYADDVTTNEGGVRRHVAAPSTRSIEETYQAFAVDRKTHEDYVASGFWPKHEASCVQFGEMCEYSVECTQFTEGDYDRRERLVNITTTEIKENGSDTDQVYE